jgi:hypothetical protein
MGRSATVDGTIDLPHDEDDDEMMNVVSFLAHHTTTVAHTQKHTHTKHARTGNVALFHFP